MSRRRKSRKWPGNAMWRLYLVRAKLAGLRTDRWDRVTRQGRRGAFSGLQLAVLAAETERDAKV